MKEKHGTAPVYRLEKKKIHEKETKKTRRARNLIKANDTTAVACIGKLLLIDNSIPLYQMSNQETTTR